MISILLFSSFFVNYICSTNDVNELCSTYLIRFESGSIIIKDRKSIHIEINLNETNTDITCYYIEPCEINKINDNLVQEACNYVINFIVIFVYDL